MKALAVRRVPRTFAPPSADFMTRAASHNLRIAAMRAENGQRQVVPRDVVCLTNGRYTVRFSARGGGQSQWGKLAVTRWSGDPICDIDGFHVYLRDLEDNFLWSAGYQPTRTASDIYEFRSDGDVAEIVRTDRRIECRFSVCVAPEHDCELRRCRLLNCDDRTRTVEVTSYLEWVLAPHEADANHPAFSKLFIETQYCAKRNAIIARRRPRSGDDAQTWGVHALVCGDARPLESVQFETDRVAFIGRGGTLNRPRAMATSAALAGHAGPVLDPIGSLRTAFALGPGESCEVAFLLGAAASREVLLEMLNAFREMADIAAVSAAAADGVGLSGAVDVPLVPSSLGSGARIIVHRPHRMPSPEALTEPAEEKFLPASEETAAFFSRRIKLSESLEFDNGYGGFSADGREYVVRLKPDASGEHRRPPMPWVNVIANEAAGFLVTECGAGYMWAGNSRLNRLTAWHNDALCDPHAEAVWIRDEDAGIFWSATPGPTPAPAEYVVRHGFGYTTFEHESFELSQETTMFMARQDPLKIMRLRLVNHSNQPRRLSLFSYVHWAIGGLACETRDSISTEYDARHRVILATNPRRETYDGHVAFSAVHGGNVASGSDCSILPLPPGEGRGEGEFRRPGTPSPYPLPKGEGSESWTCDRAGFLGDAGDIAAPAALASHSELDGRAGDGLDPCAAWRVTIELPAGGTYECAFLLGEAADRDAATRLVDSYRGAGRVSRAFDEVQSFWRHTLSAIEIETPDREIDLMVNGWLTYQNLSCRMWGRSAYYQPGGAFGFRDQLQDAAALIYARPDITREQIVRHASQQFIEGDVLHWWHPDTGYGLRTRFSDDLLWLPYVAAGYIQTTGDASILEEPAPYIAGPAIPARHVETYLRPTPAGQHGSIYEHCCRTLDRGLTVGPHGLPLIGCGDWNDGFSTVGELGRGESVWLGFFIHFVVGQFLPICSERGDEERVSRYTAYRSRLEDALNTAGWDGTWYRRAYYDNGQPMGSAGSDECQIDALVQAWAVLSGVAPVARAHAAMSAVEERLVCAEAGMIRLLAPPFDRTPNEPGYIKGYLPGIRENGGQYTHGVLWIVRAIAESGRGTKAVELLRMLSPVWHTATAQRTEVYQTEPYAVAADIYGEPPHVGRGGWTWYTGSAGWMFRVAVESIFGLSIDRGRALVVKPAISQSWPRCRLTYRVPGGSTRYEITIENPNGRETSVRTATLDGGELEVENGAARIPLQHDGGMHRVVIWL
jgi:N,N'-diacetylchitobiose phosphorylase